MAMGRTSISAYKQMDITSILSGLKGTVLDAKNFAILEAAYKLQQENIEQLKTNNAALAENLQLLRERLQDLRDEMTQISSTNHRLESDNAALKEAYEEALAARQPRPRYEPSPVAWDVLEAFEKRDVDYLREETLIPEVKHSRITILAALDELRSKNLIGTKAGGFELYSAGKKFIVDRPPSRRSTPAPGET
jgi:chromosome segregation ATPase